VKIATSTSLPNFEINKTEGEKIKYKLAVNNDAYFKVLNKVTEKGV